MIYNKKFFNNNKKFFFIILISIIILTIISLITNALTSNKLKEKDLQKNGEVNVKKLIINEIMPSNKGAVNVNGQVCDWVEIYNGNDYAVNLKNYGLSDKNNKTKWAFPDTSINPKSYLVVNLCGNNGKGLIANFKLSNDGSESLFFINAKGKVIDAVDISKVDSNFVIARDLNGNLFSTSNFTPGYPNTEEGFKEYQDSLLEESSIKINEVLPKNNGNFKNNYNEYSGYIEIINTGEDTVNLKNYCVSDSIYSPYKYCLGNIKLKSGNVLLINMGDYYSNNDDIYSGFNLKSKNGEAILTNNDGKIIDKINYTNIANGIALVRENDSFYETTNISPGFENTPSGIENFYKSKLKNNSDLIINEIMNNNSSYLPQNGNKYYDWIELKNNSNKKINLSDYCLSTTSNNLSMYKLPDIELKPGEYYLLIASGDENLSNNSYNHTNFKLSTVESLYLSKNKKIIDSMMIANVPLGYSFGRGDSQGLYYFEKPTPGNNNGNGKSSVAFVPTLSINPGVFENSEGLNLEINGNGTIYYTLDGSEPTIYSKVYSSPIFLDKTTVVKAISYQEGKIISDQVAGSYIINENHTLPVLSISMNPSSFSRIQGNPWNEDLETKAYAELYEDGKSFSIPCGFKLFGGSTRGLQKKSFSLKFRKKYGAGSLKYQVFENRDYSEFDSLVIRSGSQDSESAFIRDILMTSIVDGKINVKVQAYKSVALYINGNYWGIYNIREKVDDDFIANNFNVNPEDANIVRIDNNVTTGSSKKYSDLLNYVTSHDMTKTESYNHVKNEMNIDSYIDFWVAENWVTNNDIVNTRFYWHPNVNNGKINMIFYDLDFAMWNHNTNYYAFSTNPNGMSRLNVSTTLMRALMQNSEFKNDYKERVCYQYKNIWNEKNVLNKIDEIYNDLKPEMERNQLRWSQTMKNWEDEVEYLRDYTKKRESYFKSTTKSFFKMSDKEMKECFGD